MDARTREASRLVLAVVGIEQRVCSKREEAKGISSAYRVSGLWQFYVKIGIYPQDGLLRLR